MAIFRFIFWLLLLFNLVLLTLMPGPLPGLSTLEPERLSQQLQPERIKLQSNPLTNAASPAPGSAAVSPAATAAATLAISSAVSPTASTSAALCTEIGNFNSSAAAKFEARLARMKLPSLPVKQLVQPPASNLVLVPPQPDEAGANRRLAQLRTLGFNDVSVIKEPLSRRWGISVGLFSSTELAVAQVDSLRKAGVTDARIEEYPINSARFAYQLQGDAADDKPELKAALADFPGVELRRCKH